MKTDEQKKVVSKFTILCWATFIAILGHMGPAGCGLDTSALNQSTSLSSHSNPPQSLQLDIQGLSRKSPVIVNITRMVTFDVNWQPKRVDWIAHA